jgi:hypothetical protein
MVQLTSRLNAVVFDSVSKVSYATAVLLKTFGFAPFVNSPISDIGTTKYEP